MHKRPKSSKDIFKVAPASSALHVIYENEFMFKTPSVPQFFRAGQINYPNKKYIKSQELAFPLCDSELLSFEKSDMIYDCWSSLLLPFEEWKEPEEAKVDSLISSNTRMSGFHIEDDNTCCTRSTDLKDYDIINVDKDWLWYKQFFYRNKKAIHYISSVDKSILSVIKLSNGMKRGLLLNKNGYGRMLIPSFISSNQVTFAFPTHKKPKKFAYSTEIDDKLLSFEQTMQEKKAEPSQLSFQEKYPELNTNLGLMYCMNDEDFYQEMIKEYASEDKSNILKECLA